MSEILLEEFEINSEKDIENPLKELLGTNTRNGHSKKQLKSSYGNIDIDVPRDREGTFNPIVVPK